MTNKAQRVKIIDTFYDKEKEIVKWKIKFLEEHEGPDEITLAWKTSDFSKILGFKRIIPFDLMADFTKKMENKEINLVMSAESKILGSENMKTDISVKNIHDVLDKYPYKELAEELQNED